jgi:hypothetical protein
MSTGEINYDDLIYKDGNGIYYNGSFIFLVLLTIVMTILVTNLLISKNTMFSPHFHVSPRLHRLGLAVGDIEPIINEAREARLDNLYELTKDFEILKYAVVWIFNRTCKCCFHAPQHYQEHDLTKRWKEFRKFRKQLLMACSREVVKGEDSDGSDDEQDDYTTTVLEELRQGMRKSRQTPLKPVETVSGPTNLTQVNKIKSHTESYWS